MLVKFHTEGPCDDAKCYMLNAICIILYAKDYMLNAIYFVF